MINDAVEAYRKQVEQKARRIYDTIAGAPGETSGEEAQDS